jgi:hypothetical protein
MRRDGRQDGVEGAGTRMRAQTTKQLSYILSTPLLWQMFNGAMCGTSCTKAANRVIKIEPCY